MTENNEPDKPCAIMCPRCSACLDTFPDHGNCPGCGVAYVKDFIVKSQYTTACRKCNYELAGLPKSGKCPECGSTYKILTRFDTGHKPYQLQAPPTKYRKPNLVLCAVPPVMLIVAAVLLSFKGLIPALGIGGFAGIFSALALTTLLGSKQMKSDRVARGQESFEGETVVTILLILFNSLTLIVTIGICCGPMILLGACMA